MKRVICLLCVFVLLCFCLTACASEDKDSATKTEATADEVIDSDDPWNDDYSSVKTMSEFIEVSKIDEYYADHQDDSDEDNIYASITPLALDDDTFCLEYKYKDACNETQLAEGKAAFEEDTSLQYAKESAAVILDYFKERTSISNPKVSFRYIDNAEAEIWSGTYSYDEVAELIETLKAEAASESAAQAASEIVSELSE